MKISDIIETYEEAAEILKGDPEERVIRTHTKTGTFWHFARDGRGLSQDVAEHLEPCHDGLPFLEEEISQTYRI